MSSSVKRVELDRFYESEVQTRGLISVLDETGKEAFQCVSLELPWKDNANRVSRIPAGKYQLKQRPASHSGSFDYDHFIVKGVEGRSYILFHKGAIYTHTLGCVLVGHKFQDINGDGHPDVRQSGAALQGLRDVIVSESVPLVVRDRISEVEGPVPVEEPETIDVSAAQVSENIPDRL